MATTVTADGSMKTLPNTWNTQLPEQDRKWVKDALFSPLQLWYYPPQEDLIKSYPPSSSGEFFKHRFFLWMPKTMFEYRFTCQACGNGTMVSAGMYKCLRKVFDISGIFYMGTEYLKCNKDVCKKKVAGWHPAIFAQLDLAHASLFPAVLSYKLAVSKTVINMMKERTLGNSITQLLRKLEEQYSTEHLERCLRYFMKLKLVLDGLIWS